jgi:hypothetical protein
VYNCIADFLKSLLLFRSPDPFGLVTSDSNQGRDYVGSMVPQLVIEVHEAKETSDLPLVLWLSLS